MKVSCTAAVWRGGGATGGGAAGAAAAMACLLANRCAGGGGAPCVDRDGGPGKQQRRPSRQLRWRHQWRRQRGERGRSCRWPRRRRNRRGGRRRHRAAPAPAAPVEPPPLHHLHRRGGARLPPVLFDNISLLLGDLENPVVSATRPDDRLAASVRVAGIDVPSRFWAFGVGGVAAAGVGAFDADLMAVGPVAGECVQAVWLTVELPPPVALPEWGGCRRRSASCSRAAGQAASRGGSFAAAAPAVAAAANAAPAAAAPAAVAAAAAVATASGGRRSAADTAAKAAAATPPLHKVATAPTTRCGVLRSTATCCGLGGRAGEDQEPGGVDGVAGEAPPIQHAGHFAAGRGGDAGGAGGFGLDGVIWRLSPPRRASASPPLTSRPPFLLLLTPTSNPFRHNQSSPSSLLHRERDLGSRRSSMIKKTSSQCSSFHQVT